MNRILYIFFLFVIANSLFADGPPIDSTGKIYTKYVYVILDSNQIIHLQKNRYLILTEAQQKRLHFLSLPKYVDVLDPFHKGCTCAQIYGMWYEINKIAFEVKDTNKVNIVDKDDEIYNGYKTDYTLKTDNSTFFISSNGELYQNDELIDLKSLPRIYQPPLNKNTDAKSVLKTKEKFRRCIPPDFIVRWM
jgi:hypothetical protein